MRTISNTIFRVLAGAAAALGLAIAQDKAPEPTGFIRLVNGVAPGTGPLFLHINGENMRPAGYNLGDATGGIGLRAGSHKITVSREGVSEGSTTVNLGKDHTVTVIPFAVKVPASDTEPAHFKIQILRLKQKDVESGRVATFVSVSENPELKVEVKSEEGNWSTAFVKRLSITEVPLKYSQGYAPAKVAGNPIKPIPIGGAGNYVIVLYDDPEGNVQSLYFRDFKFLSAD